MSLRTANIEVSLQRLSILRIEHPQANPLKLACTLRAGETLPSGMTVTAEIHTSRNVDAETAPLASSSVTVAADATGFDVDFTSAQLNQTVTPDSTRALWLVMYGVGDSDQLYTLAAADLLLGWHAISTLTADPPATSILVEKGGVAWATGRQYASGTMVTRSGTAYVASSAHTSSAGDEPGVGQEWESFWAVLSGGTGTTNLSVTTTATAVTVASSSGDDAVIPAATGTDAGAFPAALHTKLTDLPTASALTTSLGGKADTTHTHSISDVTGLQTALDSKAATSHTHTASQISDSTSAGRGLLTAADAAAQRTILGLGTLATQSGTFSGTSSGTNTGDQNTFSTIAVSGQSSVAADSATDTLTLVAGTGITITTNAATDAITISATATGGGTNTIIQKFPEDASFPTTNFATRDTRNNHPVLDFDASTPETAYFKAFIPQGATFAASGTALTFVIESTATSATTGNIGWGVSLERLVANGIDIDADAFGTEQTGSTAVNATSGKSSEVTIAFTLAQLPSGIAAGDMLRICLKRNTAVSGNHSGDAEFLGLYANMTPDIP